MRKLFDRIKENKEYILFTSFGVAVSLAVIVYLIKKYAINVPFGDDWAMVPIFRHIDQGNFSFGDLWAQHNEHRILFPRLLIIGLAYITNWHLGADMIANVAVSFLSLLIIISFVWRNIKHKWLASFTSVIMAGWFYSTVQWENWLWGWQIEWFLCIAAFFATLFIVDRINDKTRYPHILYASAVLTAVVATFSLGSGMLVWPIIFLWLIAKRHRKRGIILWGILTFLTPVVYYFNYHKPSYHPSTLYFLSHPIQAIQYFLIYLGRPMSDQIAGALSWGALLLVILIPLGYFIWVKRKQLDKFMPWFAILIFSLGSNALTTISRVGFGLEQAVSSRYTTISVLYLIAVIGLISTLISLSKSKDAFRGAFLSLVVINLILILVADIQGIAGFKDRSTHMKVIKTCTHDIVPTKECLLVTIPGLGVNGADVEYLKQKHWGGY